MDDEEQARQQERKDDQTRYEARRAREKARVLAKVTHIAGLIERIAREHDQLQRARAREALVAAFMDLGENGPGPDPEDTRDPGPGR